MASSEAEITHHLGTSHTSLRHLCLHEAVHKTSTPSQVFIWLGLKFDTINMSITIPEEKMADTMQLVEE